MNTNTIETAAASVIGREHRRLDRPCQDAFAIRRGARGLVAVVSDGCGSGAHSELGARLGAHLFARALGERLDAGAPVGEVATWRAACDDVVARLAELVPDLALDGDRGAGVAAHLLFTLVAAAIGDDGAAVLAIGDGVVAIDDDVRLLDALDGAPAYLGYQLCGDPPALELVRVPDGASIVLASDGARPLAAELPALARDPRLFRNPDALRRRLYLASRDPAIGLADDTTIVVLRRQPC